MRRRDLLGLAGVTIATSVTGCSGLFEGANSSYQKGTFLGCSGETYPDRIEFDCEQFDGTAGRIFSVEAGSSLDVTCRTDIEAGSIRFLVMGPDGEVHWEHSHDGAETLEQQTSIEVGDEGRYEMQVKGEEVKGTFELRWETAE